MRKIKNVLILAGGDSTRFWPLKSKSYFPFLGKPLIWHLVSNLSKFAENINIVINRSDVQSINRLYINKLKIIIQKKELSGQAGAILSAKNKIKGEVLILNAEDIFNHEILYRCIDTSIQPGIDFAFVAKKVKTYFSGGYVKLMGKRVSQIIEKPKRGEEPSDIVKLVIDYFADFDQLVETLEKVKTKNDDQYEQAINLLLQKKITTKYVLYDGFWYPLKFPWHVLSMMSYFLGTLKEEVKIGKNVKIAKTAKIVGPCFIDDNTVVGDFVMIRQSHIGKNCLIGGYSEITRSYLGNGVSLHRNYIGDSVLADNVSFGAQAATANFRFDEKTVKSEVKGIKVDTNLVKFGSIFGSNSKIGVNTTLLPGIKIGSNTFIGPGETIYEDIENNKFVIKGKQTNNLYSKFLNIKY